MKRLLLVGLFLLMCASQVWAASATVTNMDGYLEVTGGTDATLVISGYGWVTKVVLSPNSATDKAIFTSQSVSGGSDVTCVALGQYNPSENWPGDGFCFTNLKVTLTSSSDIVDVYVSRISH